MEFIEKEVGSFGLPKYTYFQQKVKNKIILSLVLDQKDYDIICEDVISAFELDEELVELTKPIKAYLIKKYFPKLKESKLISELNKRIKNVGL